VKGDLRLPEGAAVVTGGAGDLGRAIVAGLRERDVPVASLDLVDNADASLSLACDITDPDAVSAAAARVGDALGEVSMLVCGAGIVSTVALADLEPQEWHRVLDVSLTGAYLACRAFVPQMPADGAVVAISSGLGTRGMPRGGHYAAAKAGMEALMKSVALEYARAGVRANALALGPFRTKMLDDHPGVDFDERARLVPLGRLGDPEDVVGPALFLLGDHSRYVTGSVLHLSGGFTML
jgi:NAD(P)-dependent dehydrogenase (short-subunit alcohol dehydrogenase family)